MHNVEEQRTITGYLKKLEFIKSLNSINEYQPINYCRLCENELRIQFGLAPRINHDGIVFANKPVDLTQYETIEYTKYLEFQIKHNGFLEIKELLENGLNLNQSIHIEEIDFIPLKFAIECQNKEMILFLIEQGSSVNFIDANGENCLFWTIRVENFLPILHLLISLEGDIHKINIKGESICHVAIELGKIELLSLLNDKGLDFNKLNNDGLSVYNIAASKSSHDVLLSLIKIKQINILDLLDEIIKDEIKNKNNLKSSFNQIKNILDVINFIDAKAGSLKHVMLSNIFI